MLLLAGAVLAVQWTGSQVGWGFQFQEPGYLIGLTLVVTLFALNLFGLFDVPLLPIPSRANTGETTYGRSFLDGGLAVVLATPCSAPFLGTAVGFALTSSPVTIVSTFVAIGVGLAAPFVVASAVPAVARRLPKPGPWMETFERVLGFILLGTSVWLVWVFGRVAGVDGIARLLAATLVATFGAWIWGKLQYGERRGRIIGALTLAASIAIGLVTFRPWASEPAAASSQIETGWVAWDPEQIAAEQDAGRVVFVDFTADWCITCKVNERTILHTPEVESKFRNARVVPMVADWTRRDDEIRAELASHGRAGVPMYLVYPAGGGEPEVLPELLTVDIVNGAIDRGLRDR
jgi:thiol:disulfide interchange protein DsbD